MAQDYNLLDAQIATAWGKEVRCMEVAILFSKRSNRSDLPIDKGIGID